MEGKCYLSQVVWLMQTHLIAGDKGCFPPGMSGGWRWGKWTFTRRIYVTIMKGNLCSAFRQNGKGESGSREFFLCLLLPNYLQLQIVFMPK